MPTYELSIEEAQASDAPAIQNLLRKLSLETNFISETQAILEISQEKLSYALEQLNDKVDSICLLARVNEQVVGLISMSSGSTVDTNHISELFIVLNVSVRGQGLGKELMAIALDWAEQTPSIKKIELEVQIANEVAVQLYQSFGFEIEGTRKHAVKLHNGKYSDVYLMGKLLDK